MAVHGADVDHGAPDRLRPAADIGSRGRLVRIAATAAAAALLIYGTAAGSNDMFPFGPFTMYAGHYPPNGVITSNTVLAHTADGHDVVVSEADTGLTRAEVESELFEFSRDPDRLADLAQAFHRRHPGASPYVVVRIVQKRWRLRNRAVAGQSTVTLAQWHAG